MTDVFAMHFNYRTISTEMRYTSRNFPICIFCFLHTKTVVVQHKSIRWIPVQLRWGIWSAAPAADWRVGSGDPPSCHTAPLSSHSTSHWRSSPLQNKRMWWGRGELERRGHGPDNYTNHWRLHVQIDDRDKWDEASSCEWPSPTNVFQQGGKS